MRLDAAGVQPLLGRQPGPEVGALCRPEHDGPPPLVDRHPRIDRQGDLPGEARMGRRDLEPVDGPEPVERPVLKIFLLQEVERLLAELVQSEHHAERVVHPQVGLQPTGRQGNAGDGDVAHQDHPSPRETA